MARGHVVMARELGLELGGERFQPTAGASRVLVLRRASAGLACLLLLVAVAAVARGPVSLSDVNMFEDQPAFHAEWSQKDLQHHLVETQRMMTTQNEEVEKGIKKLDSGVEDVMNLLRHRPAGGAGVPGAAGEPGVKGPVGEKGPDGPRGQNGQAGAQGQPGRDGTPGKAGAAGVVGAPGSPGRAGNPGATGAQGKPGYPGPSGQRGQQGRKGRHGFEGPPGPPGVPSYLHAVHHFPYEDTDTPNEDTEIAASEPESMAAINRRRQQLLHGVGAGSNEDAYKTAVRRHWIKRGDLRIAQVPTAVGYDVHVAGPRGDALRATLRGEDGYAGKWTGTSSLVSSNIAAGAPDSYDFLKVQDTSRDETQYFRLPASK